MLTALTTSTRSTVKRLLPEPDEMGHGESLSVAIRATRRLQARLEHLESTNAPWRGQIIHKCFEYTHSLVGMPWPDGVRELRAVANRSAPDLVQQALSTPVGTRIADIALAVLDPLDVQLSEQVFGVWDILQLVLRALPWADARVCGVSREWRDAWRDTVPFRPSRMRVSSETYQRNLWVGEQLFDATETSGDDTQIDDGVNLPLEVNDPYYLIGRGGGGAELSNGVDSVEFAPFDAHKITRCRIKGSDGSGVYMAGPQGLKWYCRFTSGAIDFHCGAELLKAVKNIAFSPCDSYIYACGALYGGSNASSEGTPALCRFTTMARFGERFDIGQADCYTFVCTKANSRFGPWMDVAASVSHVHGLSRRSISVSVEVFTPDLQSFLWRISLIPLQPLCVPTRLHIEEMHHVEPQRIFVLNARIYLLTHGCASGPCLLELDCDGLRLQSIRVAPHDWVRGTASWRWDGRYAIAPLSNGRLCALWNCPEDIYKTSNAVSEQYKVILDQCG